MKNTLYLVTILILYTSNTVIWSCNIHVCLTWQAEKDGISFRCKVNKLKWKVMFYNPSNKEIAHCLTPFPTPACFTSPKNTIRQSHLTNTTIFIVKQHIQSSLNGTWKCTHGTNIDEATVNITVLKENVYKKRETKDRCFEEFYAWTMLGFTLVIIVVLLYQTLIIFSERCRKIEFTTLKEVPVYSSIFKVRHVIFIGLMFIVAGIPMIAASFNTECKHKEYFIFAGILMAVIMLTIYHILDKSKQRPIQVETGTNSTHNPPDGDREEENKNLTQ